MGRRWRLWSLAGTVSTQLNSDVIFGSAFALIKTEMAGFLNCFCCIIIVILCNALKLSSAQSLFIGCHRDISNQEHISRTGFWLSDHSDQCVNTCADKYFRYAFLKYNKSCKCGNYLGNLVNSSHCEENGSDDFADVFRTGISDNGPPSDFTVGNITESQAHISWNQPESFISIQYYKVEANVLFTYSSNRVLNLSWTYSNNTFRVELIKLNPGTIYNVSVKAVNGGEEGIPAFKKFETIIGEPDHIPNEPEVINRNDQQLEIKLKPVLNNNGPISAYRIVIIDESSLQLFEIAKLTNYRQAKSQGYSYYITAEILPEKINEKFIVGDGKMYGNYYNALLDPDIEYYSLLGIISRKNNIERASYSNQRSSNNDVIILDMNNKTDEEHSILVILLSVAIVFISLLLILFLIYFYYLRNRVNQLQRQRLNDNQELTMQGPVINIENNGYMHEDDELIGANYYNDLKKEVWMIPKHFLTIDNLVLGTGKYGTVCSGSVVKQDTTIPTTIYTIADQQLNQEDRREMLKDLDVLVKTKMHPNIMNLIGTTENIETICVVLEETNASLKEFLFNSRKITNNSFTTLSESQTLNVAIDICKGMDHLHSKNIIHKKVSSFHVMISNNLCAKITGFGLATYYKNKSPNCIRYMGVEVLRGQPHTTKSDVWSFACLLWEICALGGTLYGNISNSEIKEKTIRGNRLSQLPYISDNLYQVMLNCWQLDWDERPSFIQLIDLLNDLKFEQCINFSTFQGFSYEQYFPELEFFKDSVFD